MRCMNLFNGHAPKLNNIILTQVNKMPIVLKFLLCRSCKDYCNLDVLGAVLMANFSGNGGAERCLTHMMVFSQCGGHAGR
ncbi:hypothetical protein EYC80_006087 [Monilinia laxa]|uniref:Uncharacterized protein n=1 Tax=Monilinia laxa TaxID=61186 RepID=A0A5N6KG31_MONLA|nr:hypothetical protein EYC80_006087 [Monilinia laxa]